MTLSKDPIKREEALRNYKKAAQKRAQNPEWIRNNKEMLRTRAQNQEYRCNHKEAMQKLHRNSEYQIKHKESVQKRSKNSEWIYNHKKGAQNKDKNFYNDTEWICKHKGGCQKRSQNPLWRDNMQESKIGGFWYGSVHYSDPPIYCEFWCPDLWHRIDEAQNYQSILSGKTKEDNIDKNGKTRALSRHHVYWQPKACCEWDEDIGGYYAWIEAGTKKHPNKVKYYIKGDPNKFVLITAEEHGMIAKDKIKWIKVFEELIETKLAGVCYFPQPVVSEND